MISLVEWGWAADESADYEVGGAGARAAVRYADGGGCGVCATDVAGVDGVSIESALLVDAPEIVAEDAVLICELWADFGTLGRGAIGGSLAAGMPFGRADANIRELGD